MAKLTESINRIQSLEDLSCGMTVIHRLHPMAKLITTIVFIFVVISFNKYNISGMFPFFIYPLALMSLGEIPYGAVFARLLTALPFCVLAGISNPFFIRETAFFLGKVPVSWGWLAFFSVILKCILTVTAALTLIATTPVDKLAQQLVRLKVPKIFVMQLMMTYRYLTLLASEASQMLTAYHLRSKEQKGIRLSHTGSFLGQLLLRSFGRAERVYAAMKCRGYSGAYYCGGTEKAGTAAGAVFCIALCGAFAALRFVNVSVLIGSLFR